MARLFNWISSTRNRAAGRTGTVAINPISKTDPRPALSVTLFADTLQKAGLAIGDKVRVGIDGTAIGIKKDDKGITIGRAGGKDANSGTGALRIQLPNRGEAEGIVWGMRHDVAGIELQEDGTLVLDLAAQE